MRQKSTPLGEAIKRFRNELGLTQPEFGAVLGVTGTSVYRYEAGLIRPDEKIMEKLWLEANDHEKEWAKGAFFDAIRERFGAGVPLTYRADRQQPDFEWPIAGVLENSQWLLEEDNLLLLALSNALRANKLDETAQQVIEGLLKPWMVEASAAREKYLKEKNQRRETETGAKLEKPKKTRRR